MGWQDAGHAETNGAGRLAIAPLLCSPVEKSDVITLVEGSRIAAAYRQTEIEEGHHCSYGIADEFAPALDLQPLSATAWDNEGAVRAVELTDPFLCRHAVPA